jgi:DNA ligase-4
LPRHIFFAPEGKKEEIEDGVDQFNDSYARNTSPDELKDVSILNQVENTDPC